MHAIQPPERTVRSHGPSEKDWFGTASFASGCCGRSTHLERRPRPRPVGERAQSSTFTRGCDRRIGPRIDTRTSERVIEHCSTPRLTEEVAIQGRNRAPQTSLAYVRRSPMPTTRLQNGSLSRLDRQKYFDSTKLLCITTTCLLDTYKSEDKQLELDRLNPPP